MALLALFWMPADKVFENTCENWMQFSSKKFYKPLFRYFFKDVLDIFLQFKLFSRHRKDIQV